MRTFELKPINGQKTFGRKAIVEEENGVSYLRSYDTVVAKFDHHDNKMQVYGWFSNTTARHINAFLDFYGFDTCTKKELEKYE